MVPKESNHRQSLRGSEALVLLAEEKSRIQPQRNSMHPFPITKDYWVTFCGYRVPAEHLNRRKFGRSRDVKTLIVGRLYLRLLCRWKAHLISHYTWNRSCHGSQGVLAKTLSAHSNYLVTIILRDLLTTVSSDSLKQRRLEICVRGKLSKTERLFHLYSLL